MNRRSKSAVAALAASAFVLTAALALMAQGWWQSSAEIKHAGILDRIPPSSPGWGVRELAIADSPEMKRAVSEMLNYDEAIFRTYTRGSVEITVYAAYWRPRKFPARLVAQHTPEVCWPANGWKLHTAAYNVPFRLPDTRRALPVQEVHFQNQERDQYVRYWHVCDNQLSGFASGPASHSIFILDAFWRDLRVANTEQVFFRISSNEPWSEVENEPLVLEIFSVLAPVLQERVAEAARR